MRCIFVACLLLLLGVCSPALAAAERAPAPAATPGDPATPAAVASRAGKTTATFNLTAEARHSAVELEVREEGRKLKLVQGGFQDSFADWDVHLYVLTAK